MLKGERYECDWMDQMDESAEDHNGWAHANVEVQAVWNG
jgi:hypothetical protein